MWEKQRGVWDQSFKIKTPLFLLEQEEKIGILRGYCGVQKFNKVIMPRVIPNTKEANTVPRSPYARTIKPKRRAIATSRARYQKGASL